MTTFAQNLSKMSEQKRNEKLVKTAKEAIQTYAPDYLLYTNGNYEIVLVDKNNFRDYNDDFYIVKFTDYNKEEEYFRDCFTVNVNIWAKNGIAWAVGEGNGRLLYIPEKPLTRGEETPTLKYERQFPPKIINGKVVFSSTVNDAPAQILSYLCAPKMWVEPNASDEGYDFMQFTETQFYGGRMIENVPYAGRCLFYLSDTEVNTFDSTRVGKIQSGKYIILSQPDGTTDIFEIKGIDSRELTLFYDSKGKNVPNKSTGTLQAKYE